MMVDIPVDESTWAELKILAIKKNRTIARLLAEMVEEATGYKKPELNDMGSGGKPAICFDHFADNPTQEAKGKKGESNG